MEQCIELTGNIGATCWGSTQRGVGPTRIATILHLVRRLNKNNPSGDRAENDDDVVFFNAFAALPAVDDHVEADNDNAMLYASLGPSADANDMDLMPTPPGLLADGIGAPLASEACLGLSAGRSNSLGNANVSGVGPDDVDGKVADVGDDASGDQTLGLSTKGDVSPPASPKGTLDWANGGAPSALDASLGLPAGRSNLLGDVGVFGMGPDDVDGNVADLVGDGASGDSTLGLLTKGDVGLPAPPGGTIDSAT